MLIVYFTAVKASKLSLIAATTAILVKEKIENTENGGNSYGHVNDNDFEMEVIDSNDLKQGRLVVLTPPVG